MARVLALTRDLLFGSQVRGALALAGNEVELVADERQLRERMVADAADPGRQAPDVLVVDLTDGELDGSAILESLAAAEELGSTRTLGFYSHVEASVRERAERAGFDLVVPRSRMAREGPALVAGLLS